MSEKIVFVGDSLAGKTALLRSLTLQNYSKDYLPTVFDYYNVTILNHDGEWKEITLWDTSGSNEFDHIRPLSYSDATAIVICFDISRSVSLKSILRKWIHEVRDVQPMIPLMLMGCKADIRNREDHTNNNIPTCVTLQEGEEIARRISAKVYYESTAINTNVDMLKEALALLICNKQVSREHKECIGNTKEHEQQNKYPTTAQKDRGRTKGCMNCCVLL